MQIGRQVWMVQTSGDLSLTDRMTLLSHSLLPVLQQSVKMYAFAGSLMKAPKILQIDDLQLPDSVEIKHAIEKMQSCSSIALQNHCLRTWYYAVAFSKLQKLKTDEELLAVSCLLHDLGMTEQHYQQPCKLSLLCGTGRLCSQRLVNTTWLANTTC